MSGGLKLGNDRMAIARSLVAASIREAAAAAAGKPPSGATAGGRWIAFQMMNATATAALVATAGMAARGRAPFHAGQVRHMAAAPMPTRTKTIGSANAW